MRNKFKSRRQQCATSTEARVDMHDQYKTAADMGDLYRASADAEHASALANAIADVHYQRETPANGGRPLQSFCRRGAP